MAGDCEPEFFGAYDAARGFDGRDSIAVALQTGDLALLDDVYATGIGAARIAPGHRVMAGDAAAPLQEATHDRIARGRRAIEQWNHPGHFIAGQQFRID